MSFKDLFNQKRILEKLSKFYQKEFDPEIYKLINLESLLTFGINMLSYKSLEITEENAYIQTFLLFPQRFALTGFPFFPNIFQLNQTWFRCRSNKHFITGSSDIGFKLTRLGVKEARKVENMLLKSKLKIDNSTDLIPSDKLIIESFKNHDSFLDYLGEGKIQISELDFCLLIKVRQTASSNLFEARFSELIQIFEESKEEQLINFLRDLKEHFHYFFDPKGE
ncbi:MAG: hypothetical protein ACFFDF_10205 [Candidatus Odinarchaeota archaeon]